MAGVPANWCFPAGRVAIVAGSGSPTNPLLEREWRALGIDARVLAPAAAEALPGPDDIALGRTDLRRTLDGLEPSLLALLALGRRGVRVLNRPAALLAAHDKLRSARGLPPPGSHTGKETVARCGIGSVPVFRLSEVNAGEASWTGSPLSADAAGRAVRAGRAAA